jgi:cytoskeletal protein CcmA (bactofilin family)
VNGVKAGEGATVIGRGATFRGELRATGEVLVEGTVEGLIQAGGARLTVGQGARVKADIDAQEVIVMGRVDGNIRGTERVDLRSTAEVTGDIFSKRFAMEPDGVLRGRVDPTRAAEPLISGTRPEEAKPAGAPVNPPAPVEAEPLEQEFGLFGGAGRSGGMPAGLAAAAKGLESQETPAGLNALNVAPPAPDTDETAY